MNSNPKQNPLSTPPRPSDLEFMELLSSALDGGLTEDDFAKLQDVLKSDTEARERYIRHRLIDASMSRAFSTDAVGGMVDQLAYLGDPESSLADAENADGKNAEAKHELATRQDANWKRPSEPHRPFFASWLGRNAGLLVLAIAISSACLTVVLQSMLRSPRGETDRAVAGVSEDSPLNRPGGPIAAMLVDEAGGKFASERTLDEVVFEPGAYELLQGTLHLKFTSGADLVVRGPSQLTIRDALNIRLDYGSVRAIVPPSAVGFTIETDEIKYEDIGTEFGLSVAKSSGDSTMQVFDGQVNVKQTRSDRFMQSVYEGQWVRYHDGQRSGGEIPDAEQFPTPGEIGFERWKSRWDERIDDPSLIAWFPFGTQSDPATLRNVIAGSTVTDGQIHGPRWVTGRWSGKQALLFDRETDYVELEVPGEFQELSIGAWLQVDRFDREMIAICNSNLGDPGDLHFQMNRHGLPRGGLMHADRMVFRWVGNPVPLNKWVHVMSVTSIPQKRSDIFVNGRPVMESTLRTDDYVISPGTCRLGNWLPFGDYIDRPSRSLCGRMDEVAIWDRALNQDEIQAIVEDGRPSLLWSSENPALGIPLPTPEHY